MMDTVKIHLEDCNDVITRMFPKAWTTRRSISKPKIPVSHRGKIYLPLHTVLLP